MVKKLIDQSKIFSEEVIKRVTDDLVLTETGCMEYNVSVNEDGYGIISIGGREERIKIRAHRWSLGLAHGGVLFKPEYLSCHHCDNPACINPQHLFLGSNADNMRDMVEKGRAATSFGGAKLNWETIDCIRAVDVPQKFWVEELGVGKSTISEIKSNKTWKDEDRDKAIIPSK